jgi:uncharacterized protein YraI
MTVNEASPHASPRITDPGRWTIARLLLVILLALTQAACGNASANPEAGDPVMIRSSRPTFTPTAVTAIIGPTPLAAPGAGAATPIPQPAAVPAAAEPAKAVVNAPLVNVRRGPGTGYNIVTDVERGAEFDIVGRNADGSWWQICCFDGVSAWIIADFVDTLGDVDAVPVVGPDDATAPSPPVAVAPAAQEPPTPVPPAVPQIAFDLKTQEQFPETALVRVFLYVYSGNEALAGYSLRITRDGQELPVTGLSFAGQPAFTWPFQDARQRYQNLKVEFPDEPVGGVWVLQLVDGTGATVGPAATFTLRDNDPQQELYVRYEQR